MQVGVGVRHITAFVSQIHVKIMYTSVHTCILGLYSLRTRTLYTHFIWGSHNSGWGLALQVPRRTASDWKVTESSYLIFRFMSTIFILGSNVKVTSLLAPSRLVIEKLKVVESYI